MGAVEEALDGLGRRDPGRLLDLADGRVRFDVVTGEGTRHWLVEVSGGRVNGVSHEYAEADAVLRGERDVFRRLISGELRLGNAFLRGDLDLRGDLELVTLLTRLLEPAGGDCRPRRATQRPSAADAGRART